MTLSFTSSENTEAGIQMQRGGSTGGAWKSTMWRRRINSISESLPLSPWLQPHEVHVVSSARAIELPRHVGGIFSSRYRVESFRIWHRCRVVSFSSRLICFRVSVSSIFPQRFHVTAPSPNGGRHECKSQFCNMAWSLWRRTADTGCRTTTRWNVNRSSRRILQRQMGRKNSRLQGYWDVVPQGLTPCGTDLSSHKPPHFLPARRLNWNIIILVLTCWRVVGYSCLRSPFETSPLLTSLRWFKSHYTGWP